MKKLGDYGWWLFALAALAVVVGWNGERLAGGKMGVRTKDLTFLPTPPVAQVLACGHQALAAKLRWIDSFDYFELQIDRHDDAVAGEAGQGYTRLYDILLAEDPYFRPYYDQAALNLGAVESRHFQALGIMLRGLELMPHDTSLWQQAAIELYTTYDLERKHPEQMEAFLAQWAEAETSENGKRAVFEWRAAMDRRQALGLSELPYWQEQLQHTQPGTPADGFITRTMQELLAGFGRQELQALADAYRARNQHPPATLDDIRDPDLIAARYPNGLPPWGPVGVDAGRHLFFKSDPLGYPYALADGKVRCAAADYLAALRRISAINLRYLTMNSQPPDNLEAMLALAHPGPPPPGARWAWRDRQLVLDLDPAPFPAWALRGK